MRPIASNLPVQSRRPNWRTSLLVGGVLAVLVLASLAAGTLAGSGRNTLALLFVFVPALPFVSMFLTKRFDLAVLMLPLIALAVPVDVPTGTETRLPAVWVMTLLLICIWLATMLVRGRFQFAPTWLNWPFAVFAAVATLSLVWGIIWRDPVLIDSQKFIFVQIVSLLTIIISPAAALLVGNFVQTEGRLRVIVVCFLVCGALMTITQLLHIPQHVLSDRGLWGTWTVLPAYGLLICLPKLRWRWRGLLVVLIVANLYLSVVVNGDWVSGWVPTIIAIVAATFLRSFKAFIVLMIVGAITVYCTLGFFNQVATDNVNDGSLERIDIAEQSWRVISQHWLLGTGPAGYAIYYMTYYRDTARSTHNNYLDILAQFGFVGMSVWLWLATAVVAEGWHTLRRAPPGLLRALAIIATAGWVGAQASMFLGDWVLPFAYNQGNGGFRYTVYTWLFVGVLISIRRMLPAPQVAAQRPIAEPV